MKKYSRGFRVFVRDWWRKDEYGMLKPYPGAPKRTLARHVASEEDAQEICRAYNETHKPGWRSRKAEYESE